MHWIIIIERMERMERMKRIEKIERIERIERIALCKFQFIKSITKIHCFKLKHFFLRMRVS